MANIDGIDISHWQDDKIDYDAAKNAGVKFIYHKVTEGHTYRDPNFTHRRAEALAANIPFGAYHFARPTPWNAKKEARWFLRNAKPMSGDLIPVLDLEVNSSKMSRASLTKWVGKFVSVFNERGYKVMIYTPYDLNSTFGCPLWVARYNNSMLTPRVPSPWRQYALWQFSDGKYGTPNSVPGVGKVDINSMREGFSLKEITIPKKVQTQDVSIWHFSMEFGDTDNQHEHDARKVFCTNADIITGTEAGRGAGNLTAALRAEAKANGYWFYNPKRPTDCWVAVSKEISPKRPKYNYIPVLPGSTSIGDPHKYGPKGIVAAEFISPNLGRISVSATHFLSKARHKGHSKQDNPACPIDHYTENVKLGRAVTKWAQNAGKGRAIAFTGSDTNTLDKNADVFSSEGLLKTCWDEKGAWPDTGHGNIDVIAHYSRDTRVELVNAKVADDKDMFLYTDHYAINAVYRIKKL